MSDYNKDKEELINELTILRQQVAELETQRVEAEQLANVLRFHSEVLMNMSEGLHLIRVSDGKFIYTNSVFEQMFGYESGELMGKHVGIINAPVDQNAVQTAAEILQILNETGAWQGEIQNIRKDGTTFWCHVTVTSFHHAEFGDVWISIHQDITQRKLAELALQNSEKRVRNLIETAPVGIIVIDETGKISTSNKMTEQLFGYDQSEIVGQSMEILLPDSKRAPHIHHRQNYFDTPIARMMGANLDLFAKHKDGTEFPVEIALSHIQIEGKNFATSFISDITQRKQAEEATQKAKEQAQQYLDITEAIMVAINTNEEITLINQKGCEIFGYTEEELLGKNWFDLCILERERDEFRIGFQQLIRGELQDISKYENLVLTKSGDERMIEWQNTIIEDDDHNIIGMLSSGQDITEHKQAEEKLRESEEQYRNLFNNAPIGILSADINGNILAVNFAALNMLNSPSQEETQKINLLTFPPLVEAGIANSFQHCLETGATTIFEKPYLSNWGKKIYFRFYLTPIQAADNRIIGLQAILEDITERKQAEEKLIATTNHLQTLFDAIPDRIITFDEDGRYLTMQVGYGMVFNYLQSPIGKLIHDIDGIPRHLADLIVKTMRQAIETDTPQLVEYSYPNPRDPSTTQWMEGRTLSLHSSVDGKRSALWVTRNITERKHTEIAFQKSETRYRNVVQSQTDLICRYNLELEVTFVNDAYRNTFGGTYDDFVGQNLLTLILPDNVERAKNHITQITPDNPLATSEHRSIMPDGTVRWFQWYDQALMNDNGEIVEYQSVGRDITKRKRAELEIEQRNRELFTLNAIADIANRISDPVTIIETALHQLADLTDVDGAECHLLGNNDSLNLVATWNMDDSFTTASRDVNFPIGEGVPGLASIDRKPIYIADVRTDTRYWRRDLARASGYQSLLGIPIIGNDSIVGTIMLYSRETRKFSQPLQDVLMTVSMGLAVAIERAQLFNTLQMSETKYRDLVETSQGLIARFDLEGRFTYLNPAWEETLGYPLEEILGRQLSEFKTPEVATRDMKKFYSVRDGKPLANYETTYIAKSGEVVHLIFNAKPHYDADGNIIGTQGTAYDITKRKLAEEQLRKLSSAVEQSANAIIITDTDGIIEYVNPYFTRLTGYTFEEAVGQNPNILKSGYTSPEEYQQLWETITSGGEWRGEFHNRKKSGELFWERASVSPIYDESGTITHYLGVKEDITAHKQALYALQASEQRYRKAEEIANIGSWERNYVEDTAFWSPGAYHIYGIDPVDDAPISDDFLKLIHPSDRDFVAESFKQLRVTHQQLDIEFRIIHPDQTIHIIHAVAEVHLNQADEFTGTIGTVQDITKLKQAEILALENEHLTTQFQKEQEQTALISRIMLTLSYDMRTPLAVIAMSNDILSRYFDTLTEEKRKGKLDTISQQIQFALQLLDDTVQMVRGRHEFNPALVNLASLCQISIDEIHLKKDSTHKLTFNNIRKIETVIIDKTLVSRILLNLLLNAIKYSPEGGDIRLELDSREGWIILRVIDQGMGISSKNLPYIFDLLYRSANVGDIPGTGLGLSIVKDCVDRHQGIITVQSELEKGSTFTVKLPM